MLLELNQAGIIDIDIPGVKVLEAIRDLGRPDLNDWGCPIVLHQLAPVVLRQKGAPVVKVYLYFSHIVFDLQSNEGLGTIMGELKPYKLQRAAAGWQLAGGPKAPPTSAQRRGIVKGIESHEGGATAGSGGLDKLLTSGVTLEPHQRAAIQHGIDAEKSPLWWKFWSCFEIPPAACAQLEKVTRWYYNPVAREFRCSPPADTYGTALAGEMGLGKTMEALAVIMHGRAKGGLSAGVTLVVVPNVLVEQWKQEIKDHTNLVLGGDIIVWAFKKIAGKTRQAMAAALREIAPHGIHRLVVDEFHNLMVPSKDGGNAHIKSKLREIKRRSTLLLSGTPLVADLHKSASLLLQFFEVPPFDRVKQDSTKTTTVEPAYEASFLPEAFDSEACGRLIRALQNIIFRHETKRGSVLPIKMEELEHVSKPGESERFLHRGLRSLFETKVLQELGTEKTKGAARRLEAIVDLFLAMESWPANVSAFSVNQALEPTKKSKGGSATGRTIFAASKNAAECVQQADLFDGAKAALNLLGKEETWREIKAKEQGTRGVPLDQLDSKFDCLSCVICAMVVLDPVMTTKCGHILCSACFEKDYTRQHKAQFNILTFGHFECPVCPGSSSTTVFPILEPSHCNGETAVPNDEPQLPAEELSLVTASKWTATCQISLGEHSWIETDVFEFVRSGATDMVTHDHGGFFQEKETALIPNWTGAEIRVKGKGQLVETLPIPGQPSKCRVPAALKYRSLALQLSCAPTNLPHAAAGGFLINTHRLALKVTGHTGNRIDVELVSAADAKDKAFRAFFNSTTGGEYPADAHTYFAPKHTQTDRTMVAGATIYYVRDVKQLARWASVYTELCELDGEKGKAGGGGSNPVLA